MSEIKTLSEMPEEHLKPGSSDDLGYLDWKKAKIERALKAAKDRPERRIPQEEIWKKFGLAR